MSDSIRVHGGRPLTGEITVRGANLFSGYWPDGEGGPDDEGWFATGDVAFVDDDDLEDPPSLPHAASAATATRRTSGRGGRIPP